MYTVIQQIQAKGNTETNGSWLCKKEIIQKAAMKHLLLLNRCNLQVINHLLE